MLIATLPPIYRTELFKFVLTHPLIGGARYNIGCRTIYPPKETLERILKFAGNKMFWVDLKGPQLKILKWADPDYGELELNFAIEVDLPAKIYFRGDKWTNIVKINGKKIFLDPPPPEPIGGGVSVNITGKNLKIFTNQYLTERCVAYLEACKTLGIKNFMLSFVHSVSDIQEVLRYIGDAKTDLKIEDQEGLEFVEHQYHNLANKREVRLIAARDDLVTNIGNNKWKMFEALKLIINKDSQAICASRILNSLYKKETIDLGHLETVLDSISDEGSKRINTSKIFDFLSANDTVSLADLSDIVLMHKMGYRSFLLSDEICHNSKAFDYAMNILENYPEIESIIETSV